MPAFFKVIFEQIVSVIKDLSVAQRMTLFLLGIVIFLSLFALSVWGVRPDYQPIYAGLTQQDAGEILKKLAEKNIKYKLESDGTTIMVPSKYVRELRVQLATEGLPKNTGQGYELFDQFKLGTTEFTQKINYQRALETELARTITSIQQIKAARVHLVMPDDSLFVEDTKEGASASLVLDVVGSQGLSTDQVNGVVHLVATSVKGLSPKNITVVDTHGNVLYSYSEEDGVSTGLSNSQLEIQKKYERSIQNRIESMLSKVFGPNSSVVRVNIVMNFDQNNSESEIYLPSETPIVRSEKSVEEGFKGNNSPPPSTVSVPGGQTNAQNSNYTKLDEGKNYEVSKRMEHFVKSPGSVIKMSIAVILDRKLKPDEQEKLMEALSSAAGVDKERGDIFTFSTLPFDKTTLETDKKEMASTQRNQFVGNLVKNIALVLLLLGAALYARSTLKRLSALSASGGTWSVNVGGSKGKEVPKVVMSEEEVELSPEDQKKLAMKNTLVDMVQSDPDVFARILRRWLTED